MNPGASDPSRELFQAIQRWVEATYPGMTAVQITLKLQTGEKVKMPVRAVPVMTGTGGTGTAKMTSTIAGKFIPSLVQREILKALDGRAMTSTEGFATH